MQFELLSTTDIMLEFYRKAQSMERFGEYLKLLQGNTKNDLVFPITGYNPMAKEHVLPRLEELKALGAETLMAECIKEINAVKHDGLGNICFKLALNLLDDLRGKWTNRYTADYDNKFKLSALVKRNFCIVAFWTSEVYSKELICERTREYMMRTIYQSNHSRPETLREHIEQERFVANHARRVLASALEDERLHEYYLLHKESNDYSRIFNFLYGDSVCESLGFPVYGVPGEMPGYRYAAQLIN